jgi:enoyl-CoA hydratase/carnithine racemase
MGLNRARYFLLTGQTLSATDALQMGLVNELLPAPKLLPRAWELARQLMLQPALNRRYTRILLTEHLRRQMNDLLAYGLALEGMAIAQ